jgi:hypothetical protein
MRYFTSFGPQSGALLYSAALGAIGVLEALDKPMPIGMALCVGRDDAGRALWALSIDGEDLPSRWVVVDRQFRPVPSDAPRLKPSRPGRRRLGGAGGRLTAG